MLHRIDEFAGRPDPVTADPILLDTDYPLDYSAFHFESCGETLHGAMYVAQGSESKPCVVMVPEVGGYDRMASLIFPVLNSGRNVCYFYPRGMWTGPSRYFLPNVVDDVLAAVTYLRAPQCIRRFRTDPAGLVLCGYSGGGATTSLAAVREDPTIENVIAILPFDFDRIERGEAITSAEYLRETAESSAGRQDPWGFGTMSPADFKRISISRHASELAQNNLLVISASHDVFNPIDVVHKPIVDALIAAGAKRLTEVVLDSDHLLLTKRIELARTVVAWLDVADLSSRP